MMDMNSRRENKQEMTWIRYNIRKLWLWRERRKTLKQLGALSNHMLKDIGLERGHIEVKVNQIVAKQANHLAQQRQRDLRATQKPRSDLNGCVSAGGGQV